MCVKISWGSRIAICEYARDPNNGIWIDPIKNLTRHVRQARQIGK